jgi:probable non-F420 flavinoid oxidoreductase
VRVGYHASHEQYAPGELLSYVQLAEEAGFAEAMCSDHLAPFSLRQGESGFAWSWLGAALGTTHLRIGTVNAPGQRYHPAVIGQAIATLSEMFPGRVWVAFGTGQFINEHVTGSGWPAKVARQRRLLESVTAIRALLAGETVNFQGEVSFEEARLYSLPRVQPLLFGAAISAETAKWVGSWADGLITVYQPGGQLDEVVRAFRAGGGAGKPLYLQAQHAYADSDEEALRGAGDQWAHSLLDSDALTEFELPEQIDAATAAVANAEEIRKHCRISSDPERHVAWLREYEAIGFDAVYLHNVARTQRQFIEVFGERVLPQFER